MAKEADAGKRPPEVGTTLRTFFRIRREQLSAWKHLRSDNARLRAALKPFADQLDACEARGIPDRRALVINGIGASGSLRVADLRRAREALARKNRAAEATMEREIERLRAALTVMEPPTGDVVNRADDHQFELPIYKPKRSNRRSGRQGKAMPSGPESTKKSRA